MRRRRLEEADCKSQGKRTPLASAGTAPGPPVRLIGQPILCCCFIYIPEVFTSPTQFSVDSSLDQYLSSTEPLCVQCSFLTLVNNGNLIFDPRHKMQHQSDFVTKHASLSSLFRRSTIISKHEGHLSFRS